MLNNQKADPLLGMRDGSTIEVHSIFNTIQGEGPFAGQPATFLRLAGCNLQCPLCDTEYTHGRKSWDYIKLAEEVSALAIGNKLFVITGGEPFRQNLSKLVHLLRQRGRVQVETNGTLAPTIWSHDLDDVTIVCSPKTGKVNDKLLPYVSAYKYVLDVAHMDADGLPKLALEHPAAPRVARPHDGYKGQIYLQPADEKDPEKNKENLRAVLTACLFYGYTLCLQQHKIVGLD